jgi:hypothetical protein
VVVVQVDDQLLQRRRLEREQVSRLTAENLAQKRPRHRLAGRGRHQRAVFAAQPIEQVGHLSKRRWMATTYTATGCVCLFVLLLFAWVVLSLLATICVVNDNACGLSQTTPTTSTSCFNCHAGSSASLSLSHALARTHIADFSKKNPPLSARVRKIATSSSTLAT